MFTVYIAYAISYDEHCVNKRDHTFISIILIMRDTPQTDIDMIILINYQIGP